MTNPATADTAGTASPFPRPYSPAAPSCALCGTSVHSGAILTATTDAFGAHRMTCEAWCGTPPAPALSHTRLAGLHTEATTDLERVLLAELHLTRALVHRAAKDHHDTATHIPEWVRDTARIRLTLTDGRTVEAAGADWFEWWHAGTTQEAIDAHVSPDAPANLTPAFAHCGMLYDLTRDLTDASGDVLRWLGTWDEDGSPRVVCLTDPSVDHTDPAAAIDSIAGLVKCTGRELHEVYPTRARRGGAA